MTQDNAPILPIYLVVDVSSSMTIPTNGQIPLDSANQILPTILDAMREHPLVRDRIHVSLIDFAGEATTRLSMVSGRDLTPEDLPRLEARSTGTSYSAAFLTLRHRIESDAVSLKAGGQQRVHRPAVFFLSDGAPTDLEGQIASAWGQLTDEGFTARPNVIPFGVGSATRESLDPYARWRPVADPDRPGTEIKPQAFLFTEVDAAEAILKIIELLIQSVVATINAGSSNVVGQLVPIVHKATSIDRDEDDEI